MDYNKVMFAGRLSRDPEQRTTISGKTVVNFAIASNHKWTAENGEKRDEATFVDCTAWGRTAELIATHLKKGDPIFVEGRLRYETWEDKGTGATRSKVSITVELFQFVGARRDRDGDEAQRTAPPKNTTVRGAPAPKNGAGAAPDYGDIPF